MKPFLRKLWAARGRVIVGLSLGFVAYVGWWVYAFPKQINNFITLDQYSREVRKVREDTGALPTAFDGRKDYYGGEVVYIHNDEHFMLVSYGSDGEPDGTDYAKFLDVPVGARKSNCMAPTGDTVMIGDRLWQGCAK